MASRIGLPADFRGGGPKSAAIYQIKHLRPSGSPGKGFVAHFSTPKLGKPLTSLPPPTGVRGTRNAAWQCGFPATLRAEMQCATLQLQCGVFATLPCCISGGWPAGREMQHGSVGFGPPCGHKCSVPRCNCSVGFLPHCHAAFLGGGGGHKLGFQISYFSDSDLFLGFGPFGLVKGAFGMKSDPERAKRKIGMELWNCGIMCYIALGPKFPRDPPKKQNWKLKSSEDSGGGQCNK